MMGLCVLGTSKFMVPVKYDSTGGQSMGRTFIGKFFCNGTLCIRDYQIHDTRQRDSTGGQLMIHYREVLLYWDSVY